MYSMDIFIVGRGRFDTEGRTGTGGEILSIIVYVPQVHKIDNTYVHLNACTIDTHAVNKFPVHVFVAKLTMYKNNGRYLQNYSIFILCNYSRLLLIHGKSDL